jgi:hypothetical protein
MTIRRKTDTSIASFKRKPPSRSSSRWLSRPTCSRRSFIVQSHPDLYLFSSDYPHSEGGRNPIGRFETALGDRSEAIRNKFYSENFLRIFPEARA